MKTKILKKLLILVGLTASVHADTQSIPNQTVEFVDVRNLGSDYVANQGTTGTASVNTTVLTRSQRWTRGRVYILGNNVIVPSGKTLTIEPGCIIRAERPVVSSDGSVANNPADPGALLVARGGKIIACGTSEAPILFTSIDDPYVPGGIATIPEYENYGASVPAKVKTLRDMSTGTKVTVSSGVTRLTGGTLRVNGSGITDGARPYFTDKTVTTADSTIYNIEGSWGGIVLAGYATIVNGYPTLVNAATVGATTGPTGMAVTPTVNETTGAISGTAYGTTAIEGMAGYAIYGYGGGDNDDDNSGVLRFIDNRYGGFVIAASKELNSYSFYGVGKNTVLEFLADWNNADDSYEFWGGAANLRHSLSAMPGDDGLDTDEGYLGANQYYIQVSNDAVLENGTTESGRLAANIGDSVSENDGPASQNSAFPYTVYTLANATFVARGYNDLAFGTKSDGKDPSTGPCFKDNGSAQWFNCIIADASHGAVLITDKNAKSVPNHGLTDTYVAGDEANDCNNRFGAKRTSGGFDGANRLHDLVTSAGNAAPATPDGLFNNCFFYRCGLAQHTKVWQSDGVTASGKYATRADFDAAVAADKSAAYTASTDNLFPRATDRKERNGLSSDGTQTRCNIPAVQAYLTSTGATQNYNNFNTDPFATELPYKQRLTGVDIRPNATAKTLANSSLPTRRGINTGANFAGAVRDSAWYVGWNFASSLGGYGANIFGSAQCEAPDLLVSIPTGTSSPQITFGTTSGRKYVVEVSSDNRTFTELTTVLADGPTKSVTDSTAWNGAPRFYRVICL
jgi:hypothetical protein